MLGHELALLGGTTKWDGSGVVRVEAERWGFV